jgi:L-threonylcarbamoyladenylate synthase
MRIVKPTPKNIDQAVTYLKQGKAVVFPTDTAYALGVDMANARAIKQLYQIKKRKPKKPIHIVVSGLAMAKKYARFDPKAEKLFKKFMPGKLTIILPSRMSNRQSGKLLEAGTRTIGIRMPKNKVALSLVKKLKRPITATSANISFAPTAYSVTQIKRQFSRQKPKPDLVLDAGILRKVRPSTMVRIAGGQAKIIRRGPITKKQIDGQI